MLRLAIAVVLVAHGIGHSMGILSVFKVATVNPSWNGDSWILSGIAGQSIPQAIGVVCWTLAIVGFTLVGAVVLGWLPQAWWAPLAVGSSMVSILGLLLFPIAFPVFSTLGALAVNLAVLAAVIWYSWVPADLGA